MAQKTQPLGICDHCGAKIPKYTTKGKPRMYCPPDISDCRNTANSRAGNAKRTAKLKKRIERGEWQNPHHLNPPTSDEQSRRARLGRKREVEAGTWRNPALTDEAREKLSRPRVHGDNPVLHSATEKLRQGLGVSGLTLEEAEAYREYRRVLRLARRDEINAYHRRRYRERQAKMTPKEREEQRAKWRAANKRRKKKNND